MTMGDGTAGDVRLLRWCAEDQAAFLRFTGAITALHARIRETWGEEPGLPVPRPPEAPTAAERARALLAQGRACRAAAGDHADLFATPERDVLLALFVADPATGGGDLQWLATLLDVPPPAVAAALRGLAARGLVTDPEAPVLAPAAGPLVETCLAAI